MRRASTAVLDTLLTLWVVAVGPLCWVLRDGFGPDSVESHGLRAASRFWLTFWWGPVLTVLVLLRLAARRWADPVPDEPEVTDE